jgi:cell wall-associated NlpC family hydrolase
MAKTTGQMLVNTFRQYEYVHYEWGGASPDTGWDCSGACNWIVGFKYELSIPGFDAGTYGPGRGHGPVVGDWANWVGVSRGAFPHVRPGPGDLLAWQPNVHMGMAINATRFVSAANPNQGTIEANIDGFFPWSPLVLRIIQLAIGPSLPSLPGPPGPGPDDYSPHVIQTGGQINGAGVDTMRYAKAIAGLRWG